jgi:hypothetical protein
LAGFIAAYPRVVDRGVVQYKAPWIPELGLELNLRRSRSWLSKSASYEMIDMGIDDTGQLNREGRNP